MLCSDVERCCRHVIAVDSHPVKEEIPDGNGATLLAGSVSYGLWSIRDPGGLKFLAFVAMANRLGLYTSMQRMRCWHLVGLGSGRFTRDSERGRLKSPPCDDYSP